MTILAELKITLSENGQVSINGPLEDKILCLGLLEMAKRIVHEYKHSPIAKPTLIMPQNLKDQ